MNPPQDGIHLLVLLAFMLIPLVFGILLDIFEDR